MFNKCLYMFFFITTLCASDKEVVSQDSFVKVNKLLKELKIEQGKLSRVSDQQKFQQKVTETLQKVESLAEEQKWKRKQLFFKLIYNGLVNYSKKYSGLPSKLEKDLFYSRIDLTSLTYVNGLKFDDLNAKNKVLLYEKSVDSKGRRIILFLDGHIEIAKEVVGEPSSEN